jgi:hypothetical protein
MIKARLIKPAYKKLPRYVTAIDGDQGFNVQSDISQWALDIWISRLH